MSATSCTNEDFDTQFLYTPHNIEKAAKAGQTMTLPAATLLLLIKTLINLENTLNALPTNADTCMRIVHQLYAIHGESALEALLAGNATITPIDDGK